MTKPVPPIDDWINMDVFRFLACLTFLQRLMNSLRMSHAQLYNTEADDTRMGRYMFNLERQLTLPNGSSTIPSNSHDTRRCCSKISDEIRKYFQSRNEKNRNEDVRNIQRRNASLRQRVTCKICISRERRLVFLPCGHLLTCEVCGQTTSVCPACGLTVSSRVMAEL